jgi:hypothetical protein
MPWTAEQWRQYRHANGVRPKFGGGPREAGKGSNETVLPPSIAETGQELKAMMECPALDWPTSKWGGMR